MKLAKVLTEMEGMVGPGQRRPAVTTIIDDKGGDDRRGLGAQIGDPDVPVPLDGGTFMHPAPRRISKRRFS